MPLTEFAWGSIGMRVLPFPVEVLATYSPKVYVVGCSLWWFCKVASFGLPGSDSLCNEWAPKECNLSLDEVGRVANMGFVALSWAEALGLTAWASM